MLAFSSEKPLQVAFSFLQVEKWYLVLTATADAHFIIQHNVSTFFILVKKIKIKSSTATIVHLNIQIKFIYIKLKVSGVVLNLCTYLLFKNLHKSLDVECCSSFCCMLLFWRILTLNLPIVCVL